MKKLLLCTVLTAWALAGCFEGSDIGRVKDGVMDFDKSLKVGDALGNWAECTEKNWSEIKTANGRKIVQFDCKSTKAREYMQYAKSHFPLYFSQDSVVPEETTTTFQWTINTDDTFELTGADKLYKRTDGSVHRANETLEGLLKRAYSNQVEFDVSLLVGPGAIGRVDTMRVMLGMLMGPQVSPPTVSATAPTAPQAASPAADPKASTGAEGNAYAWASIQKDPNTYLEKCVEDERLGAIAHGVALSASAVEASRKVCAAKINDIKQCMGKPNAKVDSCFDTVGNTGD